MAASNSLPSGSGPRPFNSGSSSSALRAMIFMYPKRRGSLKTTDAPDDIWNTTWSCARSSVRGWWNLPGTSASSSLTTRNEPDMPRCISRTSPEPRSAIRYLARRPRPVTVWPVNRATKSFWNGNRRSARRASALRIFEPSITGCSPRRTVSTSGNSGISAHSPCDPDVIAPLRRARYGLRVGDRWMDRPDQTTHFGFRDVPLGDKQTLVNDVFHSVAQRYDLMNDLMSAGLHRVWKDLMINALNPPRSSTPFALLDVAGGTGDVAFRAAEAAGAGFRATVCDINSDMLKVGRARAAKRHLDDRVSFVEGNAEALAFPKGTFDGYTIAFGIRNVPRIDLALSEAFRVLKPGGRFLCLEFSTVDVPGLDRVYDLFSFKVIPTLGRAVTGDAESYQYLVESIRRFPRPPAFAEMMRAAGFSRVNWQSLSGGIVALHSGWRL